jgi:hypothetical protein
MLIWLEQATTDCQGRRQAPTPVANAEITHPRRASLLLSSGSRSIR